MPNEVPGNLASLMASPVGIVLNNDTLTMETDKFVDPALELMKERNQRCVLVSHKGETVGIVSKTDIVNKVTSEKRNPGKVKLREIMTSPVVAVNPQTTIKDALDMMKARNIKQVMVHAYSAALGIVSIEEIYKKMEETSASSEGASIQGAPACVIDYKSITYTKDLSKVKFPCPYCVSPFDTKEGLSMHIDRLHGESGILEGDVRNMVK
jgi:signal-transduction protein with cAMP-binding, CBS, and nucleotidyltransferase domain